MSESQITDRTIVVQKCLTGIAGLDQITEGGLPRGRTTLVCGGPGCGKTVLGMEFLVRGARDYDEPGVFMAFEDDWLLLRNLEINGERNRGLYVLKARGTANSNQVREIVLTDHGAELLDVYAGPNGVLTGSARAFQEAQDRIAELQLTQEIETRKLQLERKRQHMEAQIAMLRAEFEAEELELRRSAAQLQSRSNRIASDRLEAARSRQPSNLFSVSPAEEKTA